MMTAWKRLAGTAIVLLLLCGCRLEAFTITKSVLARRKKPALRITRNKPLQKTPPAFCCLATTPPSSATENKASSRTVNWNAMAKYGTAIGVQMTLLLGICQWLDRYQPLPFGINVALYYVVSLKSRLLNPFNNSRPNVSTMEATTATANVPKRKLPKWTPPGVVFPIVWLLLIAPLRATSSALVIDATQHYSSTWPLLLHLCIGDVWNSINNVEQRFGVSVSVMVWVWVSKAFAAYQYAQVQPLAGKLLALPLIWLSIASALIFSTWKLNKNSDGQLAPLYPTTDIETKFQWFSS